MGCIKLELNKTISWIGNKNKILGTKKFDIEKKQEKHKLRRWDPFENTLSAAIMSGLEIIPINNTTNVMFIGEMDTKGQLNLMDLVNNQQKIVIYDKESPSQDSKLNNLVRVSSLERIKGELFSIIYVDEITMMTREIIEISKEFLKEFGYLMVISSRSSKKKFNDSFTKLSENFQIVQEVNIENYFRDTSVLIFSNKKIS